MTTFAATRNPASAAARHRTPRERAEAGWAARKRLPPARQADLAPAAGRPDPVDVLTTQEGDRLPDLVPIRHGRMLASPLAFLRGSAAVMAADLAHAPSSGLVSQLCGDAHLLNFGLFASPERRLVFDINDFDETHPGPFEWDVKRLVASLAMAGRANGLRRRKRDEITLAAARRYRLAMAGFAAMRELNVWYAKADVEQLRARLGKSAASGVARVEAKARNRDGLQAYRKLTATVDGRRQFVADPPLLVPLEDLIPDASRRDLESRIEELLARYRRSLPDDRARLFDAYQLVGVARKVVGVGSVGTRCWLVLLTGRDPSDPLLLQVKEATASVLADHLPGGGAQWENHGHRVVAGQRLMQAASDIFLGWNTVEGIDGRARDFYVRQLRDWKGGVEPDRMAAPALRLYGELCGWTLARAHARSGDRIAIAAYLGGGRGFERALSAFAEDYAQQTERDHAAFTAAVRDGRLAARSGI